MIPQIANALSNGFTQKQVIDFILKKFPQHASKIKAAQTAGFGLDQILSYLSGGREEAARSQSYGTEYEKTRSKDVEQREARERGGQGALIAGASALAAPMATAALSRAIPHNLTALIPSLTAGSQPQTQATTPSLPPLAPNAQVNTQSNIAQPPQNQQVAPQLPQGIAQNANLAELIEKSPLKGKVDELLSTKGNGPTEVFGYFQKFHPQEVRQFEKETGQKFEQAVAEYASQKPTTNLLPESTESVATPQKIEKSSVVATPQGVGEVKEIRNGKAIVEVDGKKHQVDESELEAEPKDIAQLYDDLFNAIPEQYKSRMMNFAGYDEDSNELLFRPHGGAAYVYKDIPPEFAEELKNRLHRAKTTGTNMYGMWHEGDQSYGAGMSALIKQLQAKYGGKGKEYVRKYNTLFDILGIPHEEKKRREKERREEEKRRKRTS